LAQAVLEIRPDAKLGFGPPIDSGFYYDFDLTEPLTPEDLPMLESVCVKLLRKDRFLSAKNWVMMKWWNG
jgi:threonyl-tRNA synthetase (EC 6.1.1.3)/Ser-tRNA(Thr) hydrolase (EC 3.1.1.-)